MNHNEILKLRAERIKAFRAASGGGTSGVVPAGMAGFLLAVSRSRIKALITNGRLETMAQGGQRWILFASICKYADENQSLGEMSRPVVSKMDMSKTAMAAPVVAKRKSVQVRDAQGGCAKVRAHSNRARPRWGTI